MLAVERGRAAFSKPGISFQQIATARDGEVAKTLRLYFAEKRGKRPFGQKKYRRRPPVLPGSDFLSQSCDQGKAARSSPRHRISRPFLKLNFASANPLKFQCRNSCAKFLNSHELRHTRRDYLAPTTDVDYSWRGMGLNSHGDPGTNRWLASASETPRPLSCKMTIQSQIAAATAERDRIEAVAWERGLLVERRKDLLQYLMTVEELARWRAISITIEEMWKYV